MKCLEAWSQLNRPRKGLLHQMKEKNFKVFLVELKYRIGGKRYQYGSDYVMEKGRNWTRAIWILGIFERKCGNVAEHKAFSFLLQVVESISGNCTSY